MILLSIQVYKCVNQDEDKTILLKNILDFRFPQLKMLSLTDRNLESIEGINRIFMPSLERLYLCTCEIIQIEMIS